MGSFSVELPSSHQILNLVGLERLLSVTIRTVFFLGLFVTPEFNGRKKSGSYKRESVVDFVLKVESQWPEAEK